MLKFNKVLERHSTGVWHIEETETGEIVGEIKWNNKVRDYVFYPEVSIYLTLEDMENISGFMRHPEKG